MPLTRIQLERFTAFDDIDIAFSPGANVIIGENGTGKTHLLKTANAACDITRTKVRFADRLVSPCQPSEPCLGEGDPIPERFVERRPVRSETIGCVCTCHIVPEVPWSAEARLFQQCVIRGRKSTRRFP